MSFNDLVKMVDNSRVFLCLLSEGAKTDVKVSLELGVAIQRNVPIGIVVLDEVEVSDHLKKIAIAVEYASRTEKGSVEAATTKILAKVSGVPL